LVEFSFTPSDDVAVLLNALLDIYERRQSHSRHSTSSSVREGEALYLDLNKGVRSIKIALHDFEIPNYFSQIDPNPRRITNEQLQILEQKGWLHLIWQPGEGGHLLEGVAMPPNCAPQLYELLKRTSLNQKRARLADLILGDRFRFRGDWRQRAICHVLSQIKAGKSSAPFSLVDHHFNEDLLTALAALDTVMMETPYRTFSVRIFNDSKRFDDLKGALARLARIGHHEWRDLSAQDILREFNLVPNPDYIFLSGPWQLVDDLGQMISLGEFSPSVGIPASQTAWLQRVTVHASQVICVENLASFHELNRGKPPSIASICLWGNPSPACRHLLSRLVDNLAQDIPLRVWADLDYGGFNILAMLRKYVSTRFEPYQMDVETLENHSLWAHPLTQRDKQNLKRLSHQSILADVKPVILHMLQRNLKLEQEAIEIHTPYITREPINTINGTIA
jgi:hypothetical protein